ncbi:uncharacterized protein LOC128952110 [Oppia nitens]|uniref:uncharacterized protein LOC128952110 n=1 Tax=Oppia nitens TaxID=1686743 RepID=UPI0023DAE986|nr:uncharacterized protein LOC128952110 [Oppia nitens]
MANVVLRRLNQLVTKRSSLQTYIKPVRRSSSNYQGYREPNYEPNRPFIQRLYHFNAAIMWCYIFWCFRHNWRELIGEKIWPQRSLWTDEELGVPSDEYD